MTTIGTSSCPSWKVNGQNTGKFTGNCPTNLWRAKWKIAGIWTSTPVILDNGNILCCQAESSGYYAPTKLLCINPSDQSTLWTATFTLNYTLPTQNWAYYPCTPLVINGNRALVKTNQPAFLHCIDTDTGIDDWNLFFGPSHALLNPVLGPDGKIFIVDPDDKKVYRISDAGAIETSWLIDPGTYDKTYSNALTFLAADSTKVIVIIKHYGRTLSPSEWEADYFDTIIAYDKNGTTLWTFDGPLYQISPGGPWDHYDYRFQGATIASNGDVYVVSGMEVSGDYCYNDGNAYCFRLDATTGANLYKADLGDYDEQVFSCLSSIDSEGNIYSISQAGVLTKNTSLGVILWTADLSQDFTDIWWWAAPLIDSLNRVLVYSHGRIYCYSSDGVKLWDTACLTITGRVYSHPSVSNDGTIYLATTSYLYALETQNTVLVNPRTGIITRSAEITVGDTVTINTRTGIIRKSCPVISVGDRVTVNSRNGIIHKSR